MSEAARWAQFNDRWRADTADTLSHHRHHWGYIVTPNHHYHHHKWWCHDHHWSSLPNHLVRCHTALDALPPLKISQGVNYCIWIYICICICVSIPSVFVFHLNFIEDARNWPCQLRCIGGEFSVMEPRRPADEVGSKWRLFVDHLIIASSNHTVMIIILIINLLIILIRCYQERWSSGDQVWWNWPFCWSTVGFKQHCRLPHKCWYCLDNQNTAMCIVTQFVWDVDIALWQSFNGRCNIQNFQRFANFGRKCHFHFLFKWFLPQTPLVIAMKISKIHIFQSLNAIFAY